MVRWLFTRRRRLVTGYVVCSLLVSLIIFRELRRIVKSTTAAAAAEKETDDDNAFGHGFNIQSSRNNNNNNNPKLKPVPLAKLDPKHESGRIMLADFHPLRRTELHCEGRSAEERICRAKNMCYSPESDKFFAVAAGGTGRWQLPEDTRLLDTSTVNDHNVFYFDFVEDGGDGDGLLQEELRRSGNRYRLVQEQTFAFSRFVYNNIMHNLHDDYLGQYWTHRRFQREQASDPMASYIFFLDGMIEAPFDHLFATLSGRPFLYRQDLKNRPGLEVICFADLVIGNSKEATWYDYGFFQEPQGPLGSDRLHPLDGFKVRQAADHLLAYYGIERAKQEGAAVRVLKKLARRKRAGAAKQRHVTDSFYISIFSRTRDRLILNELELAERLEAQFGLPVRLVRLEELEFNEVLWIMTRTLIAVGLHGSAQILAMFMPRHAVLIEAFPFGVPGENYLPYRTMSWLPGMDLNYRAWVNPNPAANFAQFGQRKQLDGGLEAGELLHLLTLRTVPPHTCCGDRAWNFKIYQDTVVDVDAVSLLIQGALKETPRGRRELKRTAHLLEMSRCRVGSVAYELQSQDHFTGREVVPMRRVMITWQNPWAGNKKIGSRKPSQYGVWVEALLEEVIVTEGESFHWHTCPVGTETNVWIRPYYWDSERKEHLPAAPYSAKFSIKCE